MDALTFLGAYYFAKFHIRGEQFPDLRKSDWSQKPLLSAPNSEKQFAYKTHLGDVKARQAVADIVSHKKTHFWRKIGPLLAELEG